MTKGNGAKKRDRSPAPKMKKAIKLQRDARDGLAAAKKTGDAGALSKALEAMTAADEAMRDANSERFKALVQTRGGTIIAALDDIARLASQRRYSVTIAQAQTIKGAIDEGVRLLGLALDAAVARSAEPAARRAIVFDQVQAPPGGA